MYEDNTDVNKGLRQEHEAAAEAAQERLANSSSSSSRRRRRRSSSSRRRRRRSSSSPKGANGVSINVVTACFMFVDRVFFWVLPLTYDYLPKSAKPPKKGARL